MSNVGRMIYGSCDGFFSLSSWARQIEGEGYDWLVVRAEDGRPDFADFSAHIEGKQAYIDEWAAESTLPPYMR